jgi:hypothetical protein
MGPASNEIRFSGVCEAPPPALFDFFARYEAGQVFVSTYIYSTQFLDHFRLFVGRSSGNAEVGIFQTYTRFVHGVLPPVRPYVRAQTVNACGAGPMSVERVVDVP